MYGMTGYCLKANGQKHVEFVSNNVSLDDMNAGKNHVPLSDTNTIQIAIFMGTC